MNGFERYFLGKEIILDSESWQSAQTKIREIFERRRSWGSDVVIYYDEAGTILWQEYQFLFLCQFLEFRLTEFLSKLARCGKIKGTFLERLRKSPKADAKRAENIPRLLSPASLLVDLGYTLGGLITILSRNTLGFEGKSELLDQLETFNRSRVSFIHLSFNGHNRVGDKRIEEVIHNGLQVGAQILNFLDNAK